MTKAKKPLVSKICSKCHREKPISEFYRNKARKDGYATYCKECNNQYKKEHYQIHKEEILLKQREYNKTHLQEHQLSSRLNYRKTIYGKTLTDEELMTKTKDKFYYARKYGYRSGLEITVAKQLESNNINPNYEAFKLPYVVHKNCTYTPDFKFGAIVIETKGRFLTADRMKMLMLKEQYPDIEFRFVFSNSKARISKVSQTTYGRWCEKNGFKYADKVIPDEWIKEIKNEIK